jgi:hypothetical protein
VSVVSGHWCLTELPPNILSMYMLCDSIGLFFSLLAQSFLTCSDFLFFCRLAVPQDSEGFRQPDMHHGMEVRLGLSKGPICPSFS